VVKYAFFSIFRALAAEVLVIEENIWIITVFIDVIRISDYTSPGFKVINGEAVTLQDLDRIFEGLTNLNRRVTIHSLSLLPH